MQQVFSYILKRCVSGLGNADLRRFDRLVDRVLLRVKNVSQAGTVLVDGPVVVPSQMWMTFNSPSLYFF